MRAAFTTLGDGSIETSESWPLLRAACVVLAPMIVAAVAFAQWVEGAWRLGPLLGALAGTLALLALAGMLAGGESVRRTELDAMVEAIRRLLDTAAARPDDDTIARDALRAGRVEDAIGHLRATKGLSLAEATALARCMKRELDSSSHA